MIKQPQLGKQIAELRKSNGYTQEDIAQLSGINIRTVQRIETGDVNPRAFTVKTILNALGYNENNYPTFIFNKKTQGINFISTFKKLMNQLIIYSEDNMDKFKSFLSNYFLATGILWFLCGVCILCFKWNFGLQEISLTLIVPLSYSLFRVFESQKKVNHK